jgi:hypothetical protein
VTATGIVDEIGGAKVLTVTEYQVLEEYTGRRTNRKMKGDEQPETTHGPTKPSWGLSLPSSEKSLEER